MENPLIDEKSHRQIIEGKGIPLEGGVFRRPNHPGITVDSANFDKFGWFKSGTSFIMSLPSINLGLMVAMAHEHMPIGSTAESSFVALFGKGDRAALDVFAKADETVPPKATPDAQALFVGMLLEMRLKKEKDRRVGIEKDRTDGHARVFYQGKEGDMYRFDPTAGDKKFIRLG